MNKKYLLPALCLFLLVLILGFFVWNSKLLIKKEVITPQQIAQKYPTPSSSPTSTPTPKPLTFSEMNTLYGPCVYLPTLMYHHIQDLKEAKEKKQTNLTVDISVFRSQMQYLKEKGYVTASFLDLNNFFVNNTLIPRKSVLITFDDGYDDFYLKALPILKEFGFKAGVFVPTGLMNNQGYLSWQQISEASNAGIFFANHTWSHKNVKQADDIVEKEITLADSQLAERGLNSPKVFAYPYGFSGKFAEALLSKMGYGFAFTTKSGSALCKKQIYDLPRIRIGNSSLSSYGL